MLFNYKMFYTIPQRGYKFGKWKPAVSYRFSIFESKKVSSIRHHSTHRGIQADIIIQLHHFYFHFYFDSDLVWEWVMQDISDKNIQNYEAERES